MKQTDESNNEPTLKQEPLPTSWQRICGAGFSTFINCDQSIVSPKVMCVEACSRMFPTLHTLPFLASVSATNPEFASVRQRICFRKQIIDRRGHVLTLRLSLTLTKLRDCPADVLSAGEWQISQAQSCIKDDVVVARVRDG